MEVVGQRRVFIYEGLHGRRSFRSERGMERRGRKSALLNLVIGRGRFEGVEGSEEQGARLLAHHQDAQGQHSLVTKKLKK